MSCQQVPRLTEDPYTFTEPPVTAKYFSSQSHKFQPQKSCARVQPTASSPKSAAKPSTHRATGQPPLGGLLPKRNGPIYGKTHTRQQQSHTHLPPPLPGSAHASPQPTSTTITSPATPDHIQPNAQPALQLHQPGTVTEDSPSTRGLSLPNASSTNPPPCITTTKTAAASKANGSGLSTVTKAPAYSTPSKTELAVGKPLHIHSKRSTMLHDSQTSKPNVVKQMSKVSALNNKSQFRGDLEFAAFATKNRGNKSKSYHVGRLEKSVAPTPLYRKSSISSTCSSSASSSPPSFPSDLLHPMSHAGEDTFFVRPIKVDAKPATTPASTISPNPGVLSDFMSPVRSGSTAVRSKRSYSNSSHHEALQRIPSEEIKLEKKDLDVETNSESGGKPTEPTVIVSPIRNRRPLEWSAPGVHFGIAPGIPAAGSIISHPPPIDAQQCWFTNHARFSSRDQRLDHKLTLLRRQARQLSTAQLFRSTTMPRRRLHVIAKSLDLNLHKPQRLCEVDSCNTIALTEASFCHIHIVKNEQQQLFNACTAKFSDNTQCRLPVFDISNDLPLCREHAWKVDNYTRKTNDVKPRKNTSPASHKKSKHSSITPRAPKRNRKRKVTTKPAPPFIAHPQPHMSPATRLYQAPDRSPIATQQFALSSNDSFVSSDVSQMFVPSPQHNSSVIGQLQSQQTFHPFQQTLNSHHHQQHMIQSSQTHNHYAPQGANVSFDQNQIFGQLLVTSDGSTPTSQDFYTLCENSSAYESSEDTGIGGLSESEQQLMGVHDDMLEEHDITNVLNQLPQNAFDEFFTGHQTVYKTSAEEEEFLERALEAVDEQVKTLQEMTGSDHFLDDFLDVDEQILEDVDMCGVDESIHSTTGLANVSTSSSMSIGSIIDIRGLVQT